MLNGFQQDFTAPLAEAAKLPPTASPTAALPTVPSFGHVFCLFRRWTFENLGCGRYNPRLVTTFQKSVNSPLLEQTSCSGEGGEGGERSCLRSSAPGYLGLDRGQATHHFFLRCGAARDSRSSWRTWTDRPNWAPDGD